jgi:hypothetical protein
VPVHTAGEITKESLRQRYDSYLTDHYLSVHVTIVSVTLAVAGLDAAALIAPSLPLGRYQLLLWAVWGTGLLAVADAYAGPMTGAIILPPRIPEAVDLFLPLLLGVSEFVMFSILGSPAIVHVSMGTVLAGWWFAFAAFALVATASIARAVQIVNGSTYEDRLNQPISVYLAAERRDCIAASAAVLISITAGVLHIHRTLSLRENYALTALAVLMLLGGFINHRLAAKALRGAIDGRSD